MLAVLVPVGYRLSMRNPMIHRTTVALLLLLPGLAHAACDAPSKNADLVEALDAAELAFGEFEVEDFKAAHALATSHLECLNEPISRTTAAEFHRVSGLSLFLDRNSPDAAKSFAAARAIEPDYSFPTDLIPPGNPMLETYTSVEPDSGATEMLARPKTGSIKLDGSGSLNRRVSLPAIFQLFDGRGAVVKSTLLAPGDALPEYERAGSAAPEKVGGGGAKVPLMIGAGASLAIAGGLYGSGMATRSGYQNATTVAEAESKRGLTNGLVIGAGVAGLAAVGMGTTSFLLSGKF